MNANNIQPMSSLHVRYVEFYADAEIILVIGSGKERRHYRITSSLIGWARTQDNPCDGLTLDWICWPVPFRPAIPNTVNLIILHRSVYHPAIVYIFTFGKNVSNSHVSKTVCLMNIRNPITMQTYVYNVTWRAKKWNGHSPYVSIGKITNWGLEMSTKCRPLCPGPLRRNIISLTTFSSLTAQEVVILLAFLCSHWQKFGRITPYQCPIVLKQ